MRPGVRWIRAVLFLLALSACVLGQKKGDPPRRGEARKEGFRIGVAVKMVSLDVSVLESSGRPVAGLKLEDFRVQEEGQPREVTLFYPADLPISLGLVVDTSGSMRDRLSLVIEAVRGFLAESNRENETFIVDFAHDKAELLQDFTLDSDDVRDALSERMLAGGGTPLWDSLVLALEHVREGRYERKALLVISDGEDKDSYYNFSEVLKRAREQETQVYFIGLQGKQEESLFDLGSSARESARKSIGELVDSSGGRSFFPGDIRDLATITRTVAEELRRQYRIGFTPLATGKGFRKVKVDLVRRGEYSVRTRQGFMYEPPSGAGPAPAKR